MRQKERWKRLVPCQLIDRMAFVSCTSSQLWDSVLMSPTPNSGHSTIHFYSFSFTLTMTPPSHSLTHLQQQQHFTVSDLPSSTKDWTQICPMRIIDLWFSDNRLYWSMASFASVMQTDGVCMFVCSRTSSVLGHRAPLLAHKTQLALSQSEPVCLI